MRVPLEPEPPFAVLALLLMGLCAMNLTTSGAALPLVALAAGGAALLDVWPVG